MARSAGGDAGLVSAASIVAGARRVAAWRQKLSPEGGSGTTARAASGSPSLETQPAHYVCERRPLSANTESRLTDTQTTRSEKWTLVGGPA